MNAPIIRGPEQYTEGDNVYEIRALGGLHKIGSNQRPYFSLTGLVRRIERDVIGPRWVDDGGGTMHEELIKRWPELAVLARMHLADDEGVPMYAVENGWYWLQGYLSGQAVGVDHGYHGANSRSSPRTPSDCLKVFADLERISYFDADLVAAQVKDQILANTTHYQRAYHKAAVSIGRRALEKWVDEQKPRWKAEAEKAVKDFGLKVY